MNALRDQRRVRKTRPTLEYLDLRITPTAISAVANLAGELRVESRQVSRWEASLATSRPGSREQIFLTKHIARTEARMSVQEARLARLESATPTVVVHAQPVAPQPATEPTHTRHPIDAWPPFYPFAPPRQPHTRARSRARLATPSTSSSGSDPISPAASTLPANVSPTLAVIYAAYQANPSDFPANIPATNGAQPRADSRNERRNLRTRQQPRRFQHPGRRAPERRHANHRQQRAVRRRRRLPARCTASGSRRATRCARRGSHLPAQPELTRRTRTAGEPRSDAAGQESIPQPRHSSPSIPGSESGSSPASSSSTESRKSSSVCSVTSPLLPVSPLPSASACGPSEGSVATRSAESPISSSGKLGQAAHDVAFVELDQSHALCVSADRARGADPRCG